MGLIMEGLERLPTLFKPCERGGAYAELAAHYARLHMFGRCIVTYEHSLMAFDSEMVRIRLAWLLVCLYGEDGFARAGELVDGASLAAPSKRWITDMIDQLIQQKRLAMERWRQKTALDEQYPGLCPLVGESQPLLELCSHIVRYAPSTLSILLTGATGTGKEVVARATHACSQRAMEPFVPVDCTCLSSDTAASILFGHVKGAFTGAERNHEGFFKAAHKGTIFFDEIGDLPLSVQAQFLRVLSGGEFSSFGSTAVQRVDVRVVAATNRNLSTMMSEGKFRDDLYHRIAGCVLALPPLSERPRDLPILTRHFLGTGNETERNTPVSEYTIWHWVKNDYLPRYPALEGNVRQLESAAQHAVIDEELRPANDYPFLAMLHLSPPIDAYADEGPSATELARLPWAEPATCPPNDIGVLLGPRCYTQAELTAYDLEIALQVCTSQKEIATMLGTSESTISRRLARLRRKVPSTGSPAGSRGG